MSQRPDLFVIGAAKCGTTSLYHYLASHPQIYMSPRKEPRYFAPDLLSGHARKRLLHPHDEHRYLALFDGARGERRRGEASPNYLYSREAPRLIHDFDPNAHIVVTLRDPIDMMHSLHTHHVAGGSEPIADFGAAIAAHDERRRGVGVLSKGNPKLTLYLERARFGRQLSQWYEVFPAERIHVTILEDMVRDPAATHRRLLEFLEVDPEHQPETFAAHNPRRRARSARLQAVLSSNAGQRLRWKVFPAILGEGRVRTFTSPLRRLNRTKAERSPLDPELRERLENELAEDVALLSRLLARDMAALWWGSSDAKGSGAVVDRVEQTAAAP